jgi:hypothetical protein
VVFAATAGVMALVLGGDPPEQPTAGRFTVHEDDDRLRLRQAAGDVLHTANLDIVAGQDGTTGRLAATEVDGLGGTWQAGESVCLAGEGDDCVQVYGVDDVTQVRVIGDDQLLYAWEGQPELATTSAGGGPVLAAGAGGFGGGSDIPDLVADGVTANRSSPEEAGAVAFDVTVTNDGDAASAATTVEVAVDGAHLEDEDEDDTLDVSADAATIGGSPGHGDADHGSCGGGGPP